MAKSFRTVLPNPKELHFLGSAKGAARTTKQLRKCFAPRSVLRVFSVERAGSRGARTSVRPPQRGLALSSAVSADQTTELCASTTSIPPCLTGLLIPRAPQALIHEPSKGQLTLVGIEFIVDAAT